MTTEKEKAILMRKIHLEPGDRVSKKDVEHIVAEIFGTQCFDYVTYEMEGKEEPFHLVINCKPGPVHQLGVGLRLDSEELVSVLLNVGLNAHRLQGCRLHRGRDQLHAPVLGLVGLGKHRGNLVAVRNEAAERGHGKVGSAHEYHAHQFSSSSMS